MNDASRLAVASLTELMSALSSDGPRVIVAFLSKPYTPKQLTGVE
jgi:hypothetical protein